MGAASAAPAGGHRAVRQVARPPAGDQRGAAPDSDRVPWRDLPHRYGPWKTVAERHRRWSADGTWALVLRRLQANADAEGDIDWEIAVDSTSVRAHQHAAGTRRTVPMPLQSGDTPVPAATRDTPQHPREVRIPPRPHPSTPRPLHNLALQPLPSGVNGALVHRVSGAPGGPLDVTLLPANAPRLPLGRIQPALGARPTRRLDGHRSPRPGDLRGAPLLLACCPRRLATSGPPDRLRGDRPVRRPRGGHGRPRSVQALQRGLTDPADSRPRPPAGAAFCVPARALRTLITDERRSLCPRSDFWNAFPPVNRRSSRIPKWRIPPSDHSRSSTDWEPTGPMRTPYLPGRRRGPQSAIQSPRLRAAHRRRRL